jgi:hypothetical protein
MNFTNKYKLIPILFILVLSITSCDVLMADGDEPLEASGVVEAVEVVISPEFGGRVAEVFEAGVEIANIQYELELDNARLMEQAERTGSWNQDIPKEFSLPTWYFQKAEEISAAESEVAEARQALEIEGANFESV